MRALSPGRTAGGAFTASDDADTTPDTGSSGNQYSQDDLNDLFRYFFGSRGYGG